MAQVWLRSHRSVSRIEGLAGGTFCSYMSHDISQIPMETVETKNHRENFPKKKTSPGQKWHPGWFVYVTPDTVLQSSVPLDHVCRCSRNPNKNIHFFSSDMVVIQTACVKTRETACDFLIFVAGKLPGQLPPSC